MLVDPGQETEVLHAIKRFCEHTTEDSFTLPLKVTAFHGPEPLRNKSMHIAVASSSARAHQNPVTMLLDVALSRHCVNHSSCHGFMTGGVGYWKTAAEEAHWVLNHVPKPVATRFGFVEAAAAPPDGLYPLTCKQQLPNAIMWNLVARWCCMDLQALSWAVGINWEPQ